MSLYQQLVHDYAHEAEALRHIPLVRDALRGRLDRESYIAYLTEAYHHVRFTVPLMLHCGARLRPQDAWLQPMIAEYVGEECGHEQWILDDIKAAGGDPEAAGKAEPGAATELMVAYAFDVIQRRNPLCFFGMVFVLEGTSTAVASAAARGIRQHTGLPANAFRYLTSHGTVDQEHIVFLQKLLDRIEDPQDQRDVHHATGRFFRLFGDVLRFAAPDLQVAA